MSTVAERISDYLRNHRDASIINARNSGETLTGELWKAEQIDELSVKLKAAGLLEPDENGEERERLPDATFNNWLYGKRPMSQDVSVIFAAHFGTDWINAVYEPTGFVARPLTQGATALLASYPTDALLEEIRNRCDKQGVVQLKPQGKVS